LACVVFLVAAFTSGVLVGRVRAFAVKRSIFDIPNSRSSHARPTPRGGGAAIAVVLLAGTILLAAFGLLNHRVAVAIVGGGFSVAVVGWRDDRRGVPAALRAVVHLAGAIWAVVWLGGFPIARFGTTQITFGKFGYVLAVVGIVWSINLFNFMDGIDGIAGVEALSVGAVLAGMLASVNAEGLSMVALLPAGAAAGFLIWNWPPAKIFMGDVGSGLLGFVFAGLTVASENARAAPALIVPMLLGVFVFDATITLIRRATRAERVYVAHRAHAYQRAVQSGMSHAVVSTGVLAVNIVLAVLAWTVLQSPQFMLMSVLTELLILSTIYCWIEWRRPMKASPIEIVEATSSGEWQ